MDINTLHSEEDGEKDIKARKWVVENFSFSHSYWCLKGPEGRFIYVDKDTKYIFGDKHIIPFPIWEEIASVVATYEIKKI